LGGPYKIIRLMAPALGEGNSVFEQGKPRIVKVDILKEFKRIMCMVYPVIPPTPRFKEGMRLPKFLAWA